MDKLAFSRRMVAHKAVRKQSQTRWPPYDAWSVADRCPQCGEQSMSVEIGVHPNGETQDLEDWQRKRQVRSFRTASGGPNDGNSIRRLS